MRSANERYGSALPGQSATAAASVLGGAAGWSTVQSFATSGTISGYSDFSLSVGCQAPPMGGPNTACVLSWRARSVVVTLASSECEAQMGGVENASFPVSAVIFPLFSA